MPRYKPEHVPQYFHYKRTNQGAVKISGKFFYLGEFDRRQSRQAYHALLGEWEAAGRNLDVLLVRRQSPTPRPITEPGISGDDDLSIEQVIVACYLTGRLGSGWAGLHTINRDVRANVRSSAG